MAAANGLTKLQAAVDSVGRSAREVCDALELALPERPLSRHFERLSNLSGSRRLRVCVALLQPALRTEVVAWIERATSGLAELDIHEDVHSAAADDTHLLVVAGDTSPCLSDAEREAITDLIGAVPTVVLPRDADLRLTSAAIDTLLLRAAAARMRSAVRLLGWRLAQSQARLSARRSVVERQLRTLELDLRRALDAKTRIDELRALVYDELQGAAEKGADLIREETLPDGALSRAVRRFADSVACSDLRTEPAPSAIRIHVEPELLRRLREGLRQELRARLRVSLGLLSGRLAALEAEIALRTATLPGAPPIRLAAPEEATTWRTLDELLAVELRYRGEMPRRGFMTRLMEGRRVAYMVLIFLSLFGGAVSLRRSALVAAAMPVLFFSAVAYTYRSWKHEDQERLSREVERVRDGVALELKRTLTEVQREKTVRITGHLALLQRQVGRQLEALARETSQHATFEIERQRIELRDRLAAFEQQQRQLQALVGRIGPLQKQVCEAVSEAHAAQVPGAEERRA